VGVRPDLALVSAAQRTRETWAEAATALPSPDVRHDRSLYHATSGVLRKAVEAVEDDFETVVLVGHNPDLHQFAVELLVQGAASGAVLDRVKGKFPTAAAIVFDVDLAGRPTYGGLYIPKDFGGGAED
jgi:phosphohistidine phosphatase